MNRYLFDFLLSGVPMLRQEAALAMITQPPQRAEAMQIVSSAFFNVLAKDSLAFQRLRDELNDKVTMDGEIAVVPVNGPLAYQPPVLNMLFDGMADSAHVLRMVRSAARDDLVKGIVLSINSPGGGHKGGVEIAEEVQAARRRKPVVAHTAGDMASLAYLIGSQAEEVVATSSAQLGSIGTIVTFTDVSRMLENAGVKVEVFTNQEATVKGTGIPGTSLTERQRDYIQSLCDRAFAQFKGMVAAARPGVGAGAMRGQIFYGAEAVEMGLADRVGDLEFAVALCRQKWRKRQ